MFCRLHLLALCLALVLGSSPALAAAPSPSLDTAAIDAYVARLMREDLVLGAAVAIVRGERVVFVRGYGEDGRGHAVTPETGFLLGSMSKSFTALAVMQLAERGAIDLDAPARRYLPTFRVADPAASARITVRHLLTHTSGIPARAPRAGGAAPTLRAHVQALATVRLDHEPGTTHQYASPNYLVLGAIVEHVAGKEYGAYLQEAVFAPLQMRQSATDAVAEGTMARGHRYWFGAPIPADLPPDHGRAPTAGVVSSAQDLAHYLVAQLNGGAFGTTSVLSPAGVAELHRPQARGDGFSYAFGWRVGPIHGVPAVHHGGVLPHFRGKLVLLPEQGWGVAVLTNASTTLPLPVVPTSHRLADGIAAFLAGQTFPERTLTQSIVYGAVSLGLGLVLLNQLANLVRAWRRPPPASGRSRQWLGVGQELLWAAVALAGPPLLIGLPWPDLARDTPDLALWLALSAALGLLTGAARAVRLLKGAPEHRGPGELPRVAAEQAPDDRTNWA